MHGRMFASANVAKRVPHVWFQSYARPAFLNRDDAADKTAARNGRRLNSCLTRGIVIVAERHESHLERMKWCDNAILVYVY